MHPRLTAPQLRASFQDTANTLHQAQRSQTWVPISLPRAADAFSTTPPSGGSTNASWCSGKRKTRFAGEHLGSGGRKLALGAVREFDYTLTGYAATTDY